MDAEPYGEKRPKRRRIMDSEPRRIGHRESYRPGPTSHEEIYRLGRGESFRPSSHHRHNRGHQGFRDGTLEHDREDNNNHQSPLPPPYSKGPSRKRSAPNTTTTPSPSKHTYTSLRSRIRSLEKLLSHTHSNSSSHSTLPSDILVEKERELEALRIDLRAQNAQRNRSNMIKRYHFVRFLERRRAEGMVKKLGRQIGGLEGELQSVAQGNEMAEAERISRILEALKEASKIARVDLNYTIYAPLGEKYISLYPKSESKSRSSEINDNENSNISKPQVVGLAHNRDSDGTPQLLHHHSAPNSDQLTLDLQSGILPSATGEKPPLWYTVQQYTLLDEEKGIPLLEKLRDRAGEGRKAIAVTDGGSAVSRQRGGMGMGIGRGRGMQSAKGQRQKKGDGDAVPVRVKNDGGKGEEMDVDEGNRREDREGGDDEESDGEFFE